MSSMTTRIKHWLSKLMFWRKPKAFQSFHVREVHIAADGVATKIQAGRGEYQLDPPFEVKAGEVYWIGFDEHGKPVVNALDNKILITKVKL